VNVVLDLVGASYFKENISSIGVKGRIVLVGLTGGRTTEFDLGSALHKRLTIKGTVLRGRSIAEKGAVTRAFVNEVVPLLTGSKVRPNLDQDFPAERVVEALPISCIK
jgi:NADPH:quinone reductase-like Zn-dependent oxidoreductase